MAAEGVTLSPAALHRRFLIKGKMPHKQQARTSDEARIAAELGAEESTATPPPLAAAEGLLAPPPVPPAPLTLGSLKGSARRARKVAEAAAVVEDSTATPSSPTSDVPRDHARDSQGSICSRDSQGSICSAGSDSKDAVDDDNEEDEEEDDDDDDIDEGVESLALGRLGGDIGSRWRAAAAIARASGGNRGRGGGGSTEAIDRAAVDRATEDQDEDPALAGADSQPECSLGRPPGRPSGRLSERLTGGRLSRLLRKGNTSTRQRTSNRKKGSMYLAELGESALKVHKRRKQPRYVDGPCASP